MRLRTNVGQIIRESGLSNTVIALLCGCNRSNVSRWRAGKTAPSGYHMRWFLTWSKTNLHDLTYGDSALRLPEAP